MVRCADCGFLAVQNYSTRALEEVEWGIREEGLNSYTSPGVTEGSRA